MDQSEPKAAAKRQRTWMIAVALITASALGVAILLGIQNHEDHVLTAQIIAGQKVTQERSTQ